VHLADLENESVLHPEREPLKDHSPSSSSTSELRPTAKFETLCPLHESVYRKAARR
jgi:hypothetical protein